MQWDGKIGPAFLAALVVAAFQFVSWLNDNRAAVGERLVKIETQFLGLTSSVDRLTTKVDALGKQR